jgi:DNA-binding beta-propeller fold protein YncE
MKKLLSLLLFGATIAIAHAAGPHFQEIARFNLGGDGFWDFVTVDSEAQRLFIARSNRVMVVDLRTGILIKEIPDVDGAHGVAIDSKGGLGFATAGKSSSVVVFNLKSLDRIGVIKVGVKPDAILFDSKTRKILSFNGLSRDATVIDSRTQKATGRVELDGKPESAVSDGQGKIFVCLEDKNSIARIDLKSLKVDARYPLAPCAEPTGLAIDPATHRLFVGCGNEMMAVVNAKNGAVLKTFSAGRGVDAAAFDPVRKLAFTSSEGGKLTVVREISADRFEKLEDAVVQTGARTMALDAKSGRAYLPVAVFGPEISPTPGTSEFKPKHLVLPGSFSVIVMSDHY